MNKNYDQKQSTGEALQKDETGWGLGCTETWHKRCSQGNPSGFRKWICGLSALQYRSPVVPPNKNSMNSPLLQGNEEGFRLNRDTSDKNRWRSSLRKLSHLPALRLLLDLCEGICGLFALMKPLQLKSPKKETQKRTFISYLLTWDEGAQAEGG